MSENYSSVGSYHSRAYWDALLEQQNQSRVEVYTKVALGRITKRNLEKTHREINEGS